MSGGIAVIGIERFLLIYLLLVIVLVVMKKCHVDQTKLLLVASVRMTAQLVLAGFLLTYIFENPKPLFTVVYVFVMAAFAAHRVLSMNKWLNREFRLVIIASLFVAGTGIILFFIMIIVGESIFNPQYAIPLSGMVFGNAMTGINLALKSFHENMESERHKIEALLNIGGRPKDILLPFVNRALEMALLPTLNSMVGMGIVSLPGMMTGQILSGTLPTTAILYQIAIMIAICTVVCLAVFGSLYFGYRSLYNRRNQISFS